MDEPSRRLTAESGGGPNAWKRWYWLWDVYFALGYVAMVGTLLNADEPARRTAVSIALLTLMAAWYLALGRRAIVRDAAMPGRIFAGGLVVLIGVGIAVESTMPFALFLVCPLVFMSLRLREAIAVVIPLNLLPVLSTLLAAGVGDMLTIALPIAALTIPFSVLFGTWIHRIVAQSTERAGLITKLEESREEVARLSREAGVAAERTRLSVEIHDTLAQGFTSLVTLVQAAESELDQDVEKARRHLQLAARTARENLGEARALVAGLAPSALGTGSLDEAIRRQVERLAEESGIPAEYEMDGESGVLPTVLEVVLLRAVQESLTNVRKHSGATKVSIRLRVTDAAATLRVVDDGTGFDPGLVADGFGLRGMRSRAERVGGTLTVHSGESGTTVELEVPR